MTHPATHTTSAPLHAPQRAHIAAVMGRLVAWLRADKQRDLSASALTELRRGDTDLLWHSGLTRHDVRRMIDHAHR